MSWLKRAVVEGPTEIVKLPVIYGNIYTYDLERLHKGDTLTWILELHVEQGDEKQDHKLRFEVEVR